MPALLPFHGPAKAWIGDRSFITCNYLAYLLILLISCMGDGVLVVVERPKSSPDVGIKGSTEAVELPLLLSNISSLPFTLSYSRTHVLPTLTSQCSREATATAISVPCEAQSQLIWLQSILSVAARATRECIYVWRRIVLQRFKPICWQ